MKWGESRMDVNQRPYLTWNCWWACDPYQEKVIRSKKIPRTHTFTDRTGQARIMIWYVLGRDTQAELDEGHGRCECVRVGLIMICSGQLAARRGLRSLREWGGGNVWAPSAVSTYKCSELFLDFGLFQLMIANHTTLLLKIGLRVSLRFNKLNLNL